MENCYQIAGELLDLNPGFGEWDLDTKLHDMLFEAKNMVEQQGGQLRSRQAITTIILMWKICDKHNLRFE